MNSAIQCKSIATYGGPTLFKAGHLEGNGVEYNKAPPLKVPAFRWESYREANGSWRGSEVGELDLGKIKPAAFAPRSTAASSSLSRELLGKYMVCTLFVSEAKWKVAMHFHRHGKQILS